MKILVNNTSITVISAEFVKNTFRIKTNITDNKMDAISLFEGSPSITYYDDNDNLIETIDGNYNFKWVEENPKYRWYVLEIPHTEEPADEISALKEQITNIELALCEIYESMGV